VRRRPLSAVAVAAVLTAACADDGSAADERGDQIRAAAVEAGLGGEVVDVLVLAARGATATFQVSYAGPDGTSIVVSQDPPNRRVDVLHAGLVVESQVVRDQVAYRCTLPDGDRPGGELECSRTSGTANAPGAFTPDALAAFTDDLARSLDDLDVTVEERTIADTRARCLVSAPKAGTPLDPEGPGVDTLCVSDEGAQLLVDSAGQRVVAEDYATSVPDGTFDV
jgi:hypothetical protein